MADERTPVRFRYNGPGVAEDSNTSKVKRFFLYILFNSTASEWPLYFLTFNARTLAHTCASAATRSSITQVRSTDFIRKSFPICVEIGINIVDFRIGVNVVGE